MPESITPKPEEKKTIKNEYDFRRELLSALEEDSSSNNEVKDTEIYRQHILHALGQEFDQDDIKQTNNFRAKVVDGVKELVNGGGGGGGDFSTAMVTFIDTNGEGYPVRAPFVLEGDEYITQGGLLPLGVTPASSIYPSYYTDSFTDPVRIALYKNSAYIFIDGQNVSVSGNATTINPPLNTIVQVTGNCTITIS